MVGPRLVALLRDPRRRAVHVSAFDPAAGRWSKATATNLDNPNSAVEAFNDARGRLVAVYNPSREDRRTLRLAVSADGVAFRPGCDLVPRDSAGDAAYPAIARTGPASWGLAFSIRGKRQIAFMAFDQGFLDACLP
jgi:predicted neuraminidase